MTYQVIKVTDQGGCFGPVRYEVLSEHEALPDAESMLWLKRVTNQRNWFDYKIILKAKEP